MRKLQAYIHLKSIVDNARAFKALANTKLCAVVKADAYGHGAEEVAFALAGVADCFAVALVAEAKALKVAACGKEILILCPPIDLSDAVCGVENGFTLTVSGITTARLVAKACALCQKTARVHLKVNTGMNRFGMGASELGRVCSYLKTEPLVQVEGVFSHLHDPFGVSAEEQRERFLRAERICREYFSGVTAHLSATAGALLGERFAFGMVRIGLGLYGYLPEEKRGALTLKKGMSVYAETVESKRYSFGGAGYGKPLANECQPKYLSVLRMGYADGFLRKKDNGAHGFEQNANNLCMDACIRVGKAKRGKKTPVLTDADETANVAGTIPYEVLCAATRRAERIYLYD